MDSSYFYQYIPLHIDPVAFAVGSFSVRWYALSYIIGLLAICLILMWRAKKGEYPASVSDDQYSRLPKAGNGGQAISDKVSNLKSLSRRQTVQVSNLILDFLFVSFFAAIIGARIGYVLLYDFSYFISDPFSIILPFDQTGKYIGIYGMSYHGGLAGIIIGSLIFLKIKKISAKGGIALGGGFWQWADFVVPAVPLGYFFGRIGNFMNGELYGRTTDSVFGMYFAADPETLRMPSQLFEAILEGLVLFVILWGLRNKRFGPGILFATYLVVYGIFRIVGEFFREPDQQIGFLLTYFTMGQMLSFFMVIFGIAIIFRNRKQMV